MHRGNDIHYSWIVLYKISDVLADYHRPFLCSVQECQAIMLDVTDRHAEAIPYNVNMYYEKVSEACFADNFGSNAG